MQRDAWCEVLVRMKASGSEAHYTEGFVMNAPPDLPNGEYLVQFDGHTMRARKEGGHWVYSNKVVSGPQTSAPENSGDNGRSYNPSK